MPRNIDFNRKLMHIGLVNLYIEMNIMGESNLSPDEQDLKKLIEMHPHIRMIKERAAESGKKAVHVQETDKGTSG